MIIPSIKYLIIDQWVCALSLLWINLAHQKYLANGPVIFQVLKGGVPVNCLVAHSGNCNQSLDSSHPCESSRVYFSALEEAKGNIKFCTSFLFLEVKLSLIWKKVKEKNAWVRKMKQNVKPNIYLTHNEARNRYKHVYKFLRGLLYF